MTLVITEGANWNDGMPLTMDDWLFTLQYNQDNADKGIGWSSFLTDVGWSAEGSDKIIFTLPDSNWRFHYNFGWPWHIQPGSQAHLGRSRSKRPSKTRMPFILVRIA